MQLVTPSGENPLSFRVASLSPLDVVLDVVSLEWHSASLESAKTFSVCEDQRCTHKVSAALSANYILSVQTKERS